MAWDVTQVVSLTSVVFMALFLHGGQSECISTTDTRHCRNSCSRSCPEPSSCPKECIYCKTGYYGPYCVRACKGRSHCLHNNCFLLSSGRALNCSEGCRTGWRGLSCNTQCKYPCLECDRYTGDCVGPCRDGYFGVGCSERCDKHCVKCVNESGNCNGVCMTGYYGSNCVLTCPVDCVQCDSNSGECLNSDILKRAENVTHYQYSVTTEHSTEDISDYVRNTPLYNQEDDEHPQTKSFFIIMMICSVLSGIAFLVVITISLLLFKRNCRRRQRQSVKERTDSSEHPAASGTENIYDEIDDDLPNRPVRTAGDYITPTSTNTTYTSKYTAYLSPAHHFPPNQSITNHMLSIHSGEESV